MDVNVPLVPHPVVVHDDRVYLDLLPAFEGVKDFPLAVRSAVGDLIFIEPLKQRTGPFCYSLLCNDNVFGVSSNGKQCCLLCICMSDDDPLPLHGFTLNEYTPRRNVARHHH